jgi:hypothetical protein
MQKPEYPIKNASLFDKDLIAALNKFKALPLGRMIAEYIHHNLDLIDSGKSSEDLLTDLSEKMDKWVEDKNIAQLTIDGILFKELLMKIKNSLPINIQDFATLANINPADRIRLSDRYLFDINSLVKWINQKAKFVHPYKPATTIKQSDQDAIRKFAAAKGLAIRFLPTYPEEDS